MIRAKAFWWDDLGVKNTVAGWCENIVAAAGDDTPIV